MDDDLPEIISQISSDDCIRRAVRSCTGLRIIRQQPWECLISYICATHKNIPAIKNVISNLSKEFGRRVTFDQHDFYTFPKPSALAKASIEQLKACKLGFRADRVRETARIIHEQQLDLESLREASYESARATLRSLPGVGPKVADCVLLFSLDKLEAFPVDVWMRRAILEYYSDHFPPAFIERMKEKGSCTPRDYREIRLFSQTYFGRYAGYAQEYLFAMIRRQWTTKETSISMRRPYK